LCFVFEIGQRTEKVDVGGGTTTFPSLKGGIDKLVKVRFNNGHGTSG